MDLLVGDLRALGRVEVHLDRGRPGGRGDRHAAAAAMPFRGFRHLALRGQARAGRGRCDRRGGVARWLSDWSTEGPA